MASQIVKSGLTKRQQNPLGKSICLSMTSLSQQPPPATFPTNLTAAWPWKTQKTLPAGPSHLFSSMFICEKPKRQRKKAWEQQWQRCYRKKGFLWLLLEESQGEIKAIRKKRSQKVKTARRTGRKYRKSRQRLENRYLWENRYAKLGASWKLDGVYFMCLLTLPSSFGLSLKWTTGPGWVLVDLWWEGKIRRRWPFHLVYRGPWEKWALKHFSVLLHKWKFTFTGSVWMKSYPFMVFKLLLSSLYSHYPNTHSHCIHS